MATSGRRDQPPPVPGKQSDGWRHRPVYEAPGDSVAPLDCRPPTTTMTMGTAYRAPKTCTRVLNTILLLLILLDGFASFYRIFLNIITSVLHVLDNIMLSRPVLEK